MIRRKSATSNLIIALTFGLLVFHTFTYLQNYYNYLTTLAVFALVVLLSLHKAGWVIRIKGYDGVILLYVVTALLVLMGIVIKKKDIIYMAGVYLPYVIWPTLFFIVEPLMTPKTKRTFLLLFLGSLAISVGATLSVLVTDNDAARLLAGAAKGSVREAYYSRGVGGYGFVYGCVFMIYGVILWLGKEKSKAVKVCMLILIAVMFIMIVYSSYTIALLLSIIVFLLSLYSKSKRKDATVIFGLVILSLVLLMVPVLNLIHNIAESLELEWIVNRTSQLLNAEETGGFADLKRMQLYKMSLETFAGNIFLGGTRIGGHSMVFDHMAIYGLIGGLFCISFFSWLIKFGGKFGKRIGLVYWAFFALLCVNTADTIMMHPMVLFVLPLMLSYVAGESEKTKDIKT